MKVSKSTLERLRNIYTLIIEVVESGYGKRDPGVKIKFFKIFLNFKIFTLFQT